MIQIIARYLIEDNTSDFVLYNEYLSNDSGVIKSVLKKLIGKYELFSEEEENNIKAEISNVKIINFYHQIFHKFGNSLSDAINALVYKKKYLKPGICE